MSWLQKLLPPRIKSTPGDAQEPVPEGLWVKCPSCEAALYRTDLEKNLLVCPKCNYPQSRRRRASASSSCSTPKAASRSARKCVPIDSLKFKDTKQVSGAPRRRRSRRPARPTRWSSCRAASTACRSCSPRSSSSSWAARWARSSASASCAACASPTRTACRSSASSASGGARMQEGVSSLFQMAKTTAVLQELTQARLPFVSILTDPTMGGVSASFAFVADVVHRRAGRADRLRRPARHRADGAREAARRLPARRVPAREGRDRHDRRPARSCATSSRDCSRC